MDKEEAAKTLEVAIAEVEWNYPMDYTVALEMAISALRAQAEAEKNEPLTVEELREVSRAEDYGSHIWVKDLQLGYVMAAITDGIDGEVCAVWSYGEGDCYWEHDYGKTWLAYRRKPEDGTE